MTNHRAVALVFATHGAVAGTLATSVPWIQSHYHLGPGALGLVLLCAPIGSFVAMPMAGRLAHRLGGRRTTRLLIALWCALLPGPVLAPGPGWLFVAYLLLGMAAGSSDVVMNGQAVSLERQLGRSIISGLHGLWALGSLAAAAVGILAAQQHLDARIHLLAVSALLLVLGGLAGRGLPADAPAADAPAPRRFALPTRAILAIGLVGFCGTFVEGATSNWAGVYVTKVASAGPAVATTAYTVFMLCMAGTRLIGDRFVGRVGPVAVVRIGGTVATCGGVVVVLARTPWLCMVGFALIGLGIAVIVPLVFSAAGRTEALPGEGVAGVATITYLSGLIAPAATGWVAAALSYPAAFAMLTAFAAAMALLAGVLRPRAAYGPPTGQGAGRGAGRAAEMREGALSPTL